jgi:hypothetical protein
MKLQTNTNRKITMRARFVYDLKGNVVQQFDAKGNATATVYDSLRIRWKIISVFEG